MGYKPKENDPYRFRDREAIKQDMQVRALRLGTLARVYQGADRILTGDPLVVNVVDDGPAPAWSDGQSITLNAQYINQMDLETLTQVNGLNYHELCHHLYTPRKGTPLVQWVVDESLFSSFNILEDQRIETLLTARYPSIIPFLEATVLRYLAETPMEAVANYIVVRGRRYLPVEVRQGFRDIFGLPELIPDIIRIVDEYRLLAFPRDYDRAKELIKEFNDLVVNRVEIPLSGGPSKCGHRAPIQKGRPEPGKMQERDAQRASKQGIPEAPYRKMDSLEKQSALEAAGKLETMDGEGNTSSKPQSNQQSKSDDEEIGLTQEEALNLRDHGIFGKPKIGKGHQDSQGGLPDDIQITIQNALNDVYERKEVINDVKRKQKVIIGKTEYDEQGRLGKFDLTDVPSQALVTYRKFANELQKLRDDAEPFWLKEMPSGRLNVSRAMRKCEVDVAFDRWTEQDDSADVEAVICIDRSGSMSSGRNDELASLSCWVIKRAFEHIGAPVTVYAFDDKTEVAYSKDEKANKTRFKFIYGNGGTEPYDSLVLAEKVLMASQRTNKMLFIITDGLFNVERNDEIISRLSKRGILTACVLIMSERDWVNTNNRNIEARQSGNRDVWELRHGAEIFGHVSGGADLANFAKSVVVGSIRKKSRR
jgi:hypothetical protein